MRYEHRFRVNAPLAAVAEFHGRSASMPAITPPPIVVRMHSAPVHMSDGDEMDFTMWVGPLSIRWVARIECLSPESFTDRQIRGPFERWEHRHSFVRITDDITEVIDQVVASLKKQVVWRLVGLGMWIGLPLLFAYRGSKTKRLLESCPACGGPLG